MGFKSELIGIQDLATLFERKSNAIRTSALILHSSWCSRLNRDPATLSRLYQELDPEGVSSGCPVNDLISLLTPFETLNDFPTSDISRSPSPQVAVIIAR